MSRIQSNFGLISGIPIADTVAQLMQVEARPRTTLINRTSSLTAEQQALSELTAAVLSVQFAGQSLAKSSIFESKQASSSRSNSLSATVTGVPQAGNYQFSVIRQAQSQQLLSSGVPSLEEALDPGQINFSYGRRIDDSISLDRLNGGAGVERGKIRITDRRGDTGVVDLNYVQTVDDVLDAINSNDEIDITAIALGDQIKLIDNTGRTDSNLIVQEVGSGSTAADLGLANIDVAADEAIGNDVLYLNADTRLEYLNAGNGVNFNRDLEDLAITFRDGSDPLNITLKQAAKPEGNATGITNNLDAKIQFTAVTSGDTYDGVTINFVDDPAVSQGNETVVYDAGLKTLTFNIEAGFTTANDIIDALNNDPTASGFFTAANVDGGSGDGIVDLADSVTTSGANAFSSATTTAANTNASIELVALTAGDTYDDVTIQFVDDAGVSQGSETVIYDDTNPLNKTLTISIDSGFTTAADVISAINDDPTVSALFAADNASGSDGTGLVDLSDTGITSGGVQASSAVSQAIEENGQIQITAINSGASADNVTLQFIHDDSVSQGNEIVELDQSDPENQIITVTINQGVTTANDVIDALNSDNDVSVLFDAETAIDGDGSRLVDINSTLITSGGAAIEESEPKTIGDVIELLNQADPTRLKAQISASGDQIELIDLTTDNGGTFSVSSFGDGKTAENLGIAFSSTSDTITSNRLQGGLKNGYITNTRRWTRSWRTGRNPTH